MEPGRLLNLRHGGQKTVYKIMSPIPTKIVHLLSGGIDSVVLLYDLVKKTGSNVHCVLFNYQQRHVKELDFARDHCRQLEVNFSTITLPQLRGSELTDGKGGVVVAMRNAVFLSHAAHVAVNAEAEIITVACNATDQETFPDCRRPFILSVNGMIENSGYNLQVRAPYLHLEKKTIVRIGRELGVDFNQTWSCYRAGDTQCGECDACKKREEALAA